MINRRKFLISLAQASALPALARSIAAAEALEQKLAADPMRPQFHLLPAANWMNDPNGPIYFNGHYHMFYQYNPNAAVWGDMHWGHAVSRNMIHWRHLPIALAPTPGGPDAQGCFTGTAALQDGKVVLLYTGVRSAPEDAATIKDGANSLRESQCLAVADDASLITFTKRAQPVIADPPPGIEVSGFRDPSPWPTRDGWFMTVGSGIRHRHGLVLLYHSTDLRTWQYLHPLAVGSDSGDMWECPEFFPLGDKHVLIYSSQGKAHWQTGSLDEREMVFHPQKSGTLDLGSYYAPKTQLDKDGNRILWGWIQEARPETEYKAAGWACLMSLPRQLTLAEDGGLKIDVAPAVDQLRKSRRQVHLTSNDEQNKREIEALRIEGCCGELLCSVKLPCAAFRLSLANSSGQSGSWLDIQYDPNQPDAIQIDSNPIPIPKGQKQIEIHLYVDGSVIEVFLNRHSAFTRRFYYQAATPPDVHLKWTGTTTDIDDLSIWQLSPISPNRLTT